MCMVMAEICTIGYELACVSGVGAELVCDAIITIGSARSALEIATHYTTRRKAFGAVINTFQGVSFQVAEAA